MSRDAPATRGSSDRGEASRREGAAGALYVEGSNWGVRATRIKSGYKRASRRLEPKYDGRMTSGNRYSRSSSLKNHSLGLVVGSIVALWFVLYVRGDPSTHRGAFYGNALADWLGSLMIVITTKYFYELGSAESRQPHPRTRTHFIRFVIDHSLTIVLVVTGAAWVALYSALDSQGKAGQVVGNIVSEWTQLFGLVIMTKYLREIGSKESK